MAGRLSLIQVGIVVSRRAVLFRPDIRLVVRRADDVSRSEAIVFHERRRPVYDRRHAARLAVLKTARIAVAKVKLLADKSLARAPDRVASCGCLGVGIRHLVVPAAAYGRRCTSSWSVRARGAARLGRRIDTIRCNQRPRKAIEDSSVFAEGDPPNTSGEIGISGINTHRGSNQQ